MKRKLEINLLRIKGSGVHTKRGKVYKVLRAERWADGVTFFTLKGEGDSRPMVDSYMIGNVFEWVA